MQALNPSSFPSLHNAETLLFYKICFTHRTHPAKPVSHIEHPTSSVVDTVVDTVTQPSPRVSSHSWESGATQVSTTTQPAPRGACHTLEGGATHVQHNKPSPAAHGGELISFFVFYKIFFFGHIFSFLKFSLISSFRFFLVTEEPGKKARAQARLARSGRSRW
jgi:hypothetical protein